VANKTSAEYCFDDRKDSRVDDFEKLLDKNFGISSDPQRESVVSAVQTLAQQALSETA
jgi:hypothetical protein